MRDYAELVKALRNCSQVNSLSLYKRDLMRKAADAIEELLAAVPHWISVEERLPEPGGVVLTYNSLLGLQNYGIDLVLDGEWHFDEFTQWWMPLPKAPKEVE